MKNIEITTSQNVTVQYNLATIAERAIALTIDIVVMGLSSLIVWGLLALIFRSSVNLLFYFTIYPMVLFYSLAYEHFNNGQSLGKKVVKLRVIRMDGEKTSFLDYMMRWIFRALDLYFSLGGVAVLSCISSRYNQRVGDLLANTVVVNVGKTERMRLQNLLKLNKIDNYTVTYPQVIKMPEEAMIVVKETLGKKVKYDNDAHDEALVLLGKKMSKELDIKLPKDNQTFLKTLLKDYIMLTR